MRVPNARAWTLPDGLRRIGRTWTGRTGAAIIAVLLITALGAPLLAPYDPLAIGPLRLASPSAAHLFGTDEVGRDLLSRTMYGARWSLGAAICALALVVSLGIAIGSVAGYFGGWLDAILMRASDIVLAVPPLVLTLAIVGLFRPGLSTIVIGLSAVWWVRYARLTRAFVLRGRELPFVEAARALGASHSRILIHDVVPQALAPVIVVATLDVGTLILAVAGLSFLGLGAQPPTPEWGTMINEGKNLLFTSPRVMLVPGAALAITVAGFNLVGEALYEAVGVDAVRTPWF